MKVNMDDLFTATVLAIGPSPRDPGSHAMTQYQLSLIHFWRDSGVKQIDYKAEDFNREQRGFLLVKFFEWETKNQRTY